MMEDCKIETSAKIQVCKKYLQFLVTHYLSIWQRSFVRWFGVTAAMINSIKICRGRRYDECSRFKTEHIFCPSVIYFTTKTSNKLVYLAIMGGDSRSTCRGFESQHWILDGHFPSIFVLKIVMFV